MRLLLDTHVLLWWLSENPKIGERTRSAIEAPENEVLVSVVSLWELLIKVHIKKLGADITKIEQALTAGGFERLSILRQHLETLTTLPFLHRDPFDHLLIAQAITEQATLVSDDAAIGRYPVRILTCADT